MKRNREIIANNGEQVLLRLAIPQDAAGVIETVCCTASERSYVLMDKYGKGVESETKYIANLNSDIDLFLIAQAGDTVIGSLAALQPEGCIFSQAEKILHLGIHLRQPYRSVGIGSQMLQWAINWAAIRGYEKMVAKIFTMNRRSVSLFQRAGFQEQSASNRRYRVGCRYIEEVDMTKIIQATL